MSERLFESAPAGGQALARLPARTPRDTAPRSPSTASPTDRWRPARAGICNIWEYDNQIFEFADGRLVLRGANGSGKSNALALLVPFLLDGVMAASRMDSMGGGRSMRTLLLCLSDDERLTRFRHDQRTGYAWLEFERGTEHVTIGCGCRASVQRDAEAWFFLTDRRPGIDLDLAPAGIPRSKGQLADELGPAAVLDSAESYRDSLDWLLFGVGRHRYGNLLELLVVLRRPHLAGRLDLDRLSKALSDGLSPLDPALVVDVAASFEDLEAVQADLRRMKDAQATVDTFLPVYTGYLRAAARQRAMATVEAERAVRAAERHRAEAETRLEEDRSELGRLRDERVALARSREEVEQRQRAILESPAFRDASGLAEVEARAREAAEEAARAESRLQDATDQMASREQRVAEIRGEGEGQEGELQRLRTSTASLAADAGISGVSSEGAGAVVPDVDELQRFLQGAAAARRIELDEVRLAVEAAEEAGQRAAERLEAWERTESETVAAEQHRDVQRDALDGARLELRAAVDELVGSCSFSELADLGESVALVGEPGATSLGAVAASLLRPRREECTRRDERLADEMERVVAARLTAVEERERLVSEAVLAPDRLPTRTADRAGRPGAPLYAACDFRQAVPEPDRAGLESALEAAGLLDAWIGPRSGGDDAWLEAADPVAGATLNDVLVADLPFDAGIDDAAIEAVLGSISLSDVGVSVSPDGSFRLGPLAGHFKKPDSEHIGSSARERRRRRLLAAVDARLAELDADSARLATGRAEIAAALAALDDVESVLPSQAAVEEAVRSLADAVATARTLRSRATADAERAAVARHEAEARSGELRQMAMKHRLPTSRADLDAVAEMIRSFERSSNQLVQAARAFAELLRGLALAGHELQLGRERLEVARTDHEVTDRRASGLRSRSDELRARLGADAEAPLVELQTVEDELRRVSERSRTLQDEVDRANTAVGAAEQAMSAVLAAVESAAAVVAETAQHLEVLRRPEVWRVVAEEQDGPPAHAGALASAVVAATRQVTGEPDDNALQRGFRTLLDEIGRGYDPSLSYVDHLAVVEVTSETGVFSLIWVAGELSAQVRRQESLLSERDREIFERHLLSRIAEALRELLNDADRLVDGINRSLADRPTSSGLSVQLRWELESADTAIRSAVNLLRRTPELLGPSERDELKAFFERSIAHRRAEDSAATYAEVLSDVLDYRRWFAFVPILHSARGGSQRLTRTLFRSLSGGEQAVVLHLPLFAAAAAHYNAAAPGCPRLIALDEAFAGIDEQMRGELMGLLVRFDLDVLLTGHELWGAYQQVPALMTYDLLRRPPLEGVSALPLRWDGLAMAGA
jgi:uncharacterized protein (TIGR02680 family)